MSAVLDNLKRPHRWSVSDYHRMGEAGFFAPDARVELIEGEVFDMAPIGSKHFAAVNRLNHVLSEALRGQAIVSVQSPVVLSDLDEPQPDIALLKPRADFYRDALPSVSDVLLLIEVADSSLDVDSKIKAPLYAKLGVAEFWIADLQGKVLRVLREPSAAGYQKIESLRAPGAATPLALPQVRVELAQPLA
jgi:Uma2 family endonuclease